MRETALLVIGAGPYVLATAAYARQSGLDFLMLGQSMSFWKEHMPEGMVLRSGIDWHLDATGVHTLEAFIKETGTNHGRGEPIPLRVFLSYAEWFRHPPCQALSNRGRATKCL